MSPYLIFAVSIIYLGAAVQSFRRGDWCHGGMWLSYAVANACLGFYEVKHARSM